MRNAGHVKCSLTLPPPAQSELAGCCGFKQLVGVREETWTKHVLDGQDLYTEVQ